MLQVKRGDKQSFGILVRRHIDALYSYAFRLSGSSSQAEDLVQEAWLSAWQHAGTYKPGKAKPTTWLHRILHNKFVDERRKNRLEFDEAVVSATIDPINIASVTDRDDRAAVFNQSISQLPENQKCAIVLRYVQGFGQLDVAHIMGLSVRATESLLARAKTNMTKYQATSSENERHSQTRYQTDSTRDQRT